MAMNSMEIETSLREMGWGSAEHLHAAIESMRLGFVDTLQYNADPQVHLSFRPGTLHAVCASSQGKGSLTPSKTMQTSGCAPLHQPAAFQGKRAHVSRAWSTRCAYRESSLVSAAAPELRMKRHSVIAFFGAGGARAYRRPAQQRVCKAQKGRAVQS